MGLAALFVGVLLAFFVAVAIGYGTFLALVRGGRLLWRFLVPEEGERARELGEATDEVPCWVDKSCPPSVRDVCPAYLRRTEGLPCWLTCLQAEGRLRVSCLTCRRFDVAELVA